MSSIESVNGIDSYIWSTVYLATNVNTVQYECTELCRIGTDEQSDWYFFSHKDKKYPTGTRTNRATAAGFWKATGRDKAIYAKHDLIGMRKTLVFYKGRAPNGQKSDWIMHEYRLETDENGAPQASTIITLMNFLHCSTSNAQVLGCPKLTKTFHQYYGSKNWNTLLTFWWTNLMCSCALIYRW